MKLKNTPNAEFINTKENMTTLLFFFTIFTGTKNGLQNFYTHFQFSLRSTHRHTGAAHIPGRRGLRSATRTPSSNHLPDVRHWMAGLKMLLASRSGIDSPLLLSIEIQTVFIMSSKHSYSGRATPILKWSGSSVGHKPL